MQVDRTGPAQALERGSGRGAVLKYSVAADHWRYARFLEGERGVSSTPPAHFDQLAATKALAVPISGRAVSAAAATWTT